MRLGYPQLRGLSWENKKHGWFLFRPALYFGSNAIGGRRPFPNAKRRPVRTLLAAWTHRSSFHLVKLCLFSQTLLFSMFA